MTANASALGSLAYKDEVVWGENVTTMTSAVRLPITTPVDLSGLTQAMMDPGRTVQYLNEGTPGIRGVMGGGCSFDVWLSGHGSATSGATAATDLGDICGWVLGGNAQTFAAGTTDAGAGASTATNIITAASGTGSQGGLFRAGVKGDARADGQWNIVDTHILTALVPEIALPVATSAADIIHSAENVYTAETSYAITGKRFRLQTANLQYTLHGCHPTSFAITGLAPGEMPKVSIGVGCSWFQPVNATFPDVALTAATTNMPAPIAAGSFVLGVYGSTTRTTYSIRSCAVNFTLGIAPLPGMDGVSPFQSIVGARRTPSQVTVTLTVDAPASTTTPAFYDLWSSSSYLHALFSFSTAAGQALALYLAKCCFTGARPMQSAGPNGVNQITFMLRGYTDTAETTNDLSLSMMRIGLA